jgi:lipoyl(octanoyl) transferase
MNESTTTLRLLDLSCEDGPTQLAISEAILLAVGEGKAPPALRLYTWNEPVVIIGVGQPASDLDLETCRARGYRILRRIGGGTAVYHDRDEVSVDLIVPSGGDLGPSDVHAGYRMFADVLGEGLGALGVSVDVVSVEMARSMTNDPTMRPLCFASLSPYEFVSDGRKLNGLCQIRRRDAIAYQAAIYNRFRVEPLISSLSHPDEPTRRRRARRIDEFVTDMATARGEDVDYRELLNATAGAASRSLGVPVKPGSLTDFEIREATRLMNEKYLADEWTFRR